MILHEIEHDAPSKKAFYFKCYLCGNELQSGDEIILIGEGLMSGNTPSFHIGRYYHRTCAEMEKYVIITKK